jgi:hypothetical protein
VEVDGWRLGAFDSVLSAIALSKAVPYSEDSTELIVLAGDATRDKRLESGPKVGARQSVERRAASLARGFGLATGCGTVTGSVKGFSKENGQLLLALMC